MSECPVEVAGCTAGPGNPRHFHASPLSNIARPACPAGHRDWYISFEAGAEIEYVCGECGHTERDNASAESGPPVRMRAHGAR